MPNKALKYFVNISLIISVLLILFYFFDFFRESQFLKYGLFINLFFVLILKNIILVKGGMNFIGTLYIIDNLDQLDGLKFVPKYIEKNNGIEYAIGTLRESDCSISGYNPAKDERWVAIPTKIISNWKKLPDEAKIINFSKITTEKIIAVGVKQE